MQAARCCATPHVCALCTACPACHSQPSATRSRTRTLQALGMGVHESQSLLWERMVGLSRPFAAYLLPLMRQYFPQARTLAPRVAGPAACSCPRPKAGRVTVVAPDRFQLPDTSSSSWLAAGLSPPA